MSDVHPSKPPSERADAVAIVRQLREAGFTAYFAGGCVRDELLGLTPADFDVATDAPPEKVRQLFRNTAAVGAAFGVILVRQNRSVVEVATFRSDMDYHDGRRPSGVTFTTAEHDAQRRDFTINGLFLDPLENRVIDFVGGQDDLKARIIRAIGQPQQRFAEDHLRLLRAVRFAARFDFAIEPITAAAVAEHADLLIRISPERIADELRRMLTTPQRTAAWLLLWKLQLIHPIFRFLSAAGTESLDPSRSIFLSMATGRSIPVGAALAAAALDYRWQRAGRPGDLRPLLGKSAIASAARAMRQALKISNEEEDLMVGTLTGAAAMLEEPTPTLARKKRFLGQPWADSATEILAAASAGGCHQEGIASVLRELRQLSATDFAPPPLISGDDLVAAGAVPGPAFKRALDAVYDAQLENRISTRPEAMELAMKIVNEK